MITKNHIPVLSNQVTHFLTEHKGKVFIDCTLGTGGHTEAIIKELGGDCTVYGIDADLRNLNLAKERLSEYKNVHFVHDNFENLERIAQKILHEEKRIDGILFDLGLSALHVEEGGRGFSFQLEGPLDMRFDTREKLTAADIINTYPLDQLLFIFQNYGEEKFSYRIANELVKQRKRQRFSTTSQLANFIESVVSQHGKFPFHKKHPATRIFQALRIAANREVEVLQKGLAAAVNAASVGGRVVVISYHSIEDRIVKNIFRDAKKQGTLKVLTKKPLEPTEEEMELNRKSRSAKLRAAEKF